MACLQHEHMQGYFPTGGWGAFWSGQPTRGFDVSQPGGWNDNLPYLELGSLHDLGMGQGTATTPVRPGFLQRVKTPIATFICPTRRQPIAYAYTNGGTGSVNVPADPGTVGRSDYAGNAGEMLGVILPTFPEHVRDRPARFPCNRRPAEHSTVGWFSREPD